MILDTKLILKPGLLHQFSSISDVVLRCLDVKQPVMASAHAQLTNVPVRSTRELQLHRVSTTDTFSLVQSMISVFLVNRKSETVVNRVSLIHTLALPV